MAQLVSGSELVLMKIIWKNGRIVKNLVSTLLRQDILSADELKEIEIFWRKENE
ncbi:MAG: hypothetical protein K2I96_17320 [Lachnospiraceae bacterium]|nr:hypothetical protein [Lachnospiraceae bacterium]